ncbi:MAG: response regulator [Sphingobacteriia bacterium]|nr:response regulator [Sphingobacteriia bacterium]
MNIHLTDARILIVDDQTANIEILENLLLIKGYKNIWATTDPREVLPIVKNFNPDLLLLDLMMPHLSGYDIMEQLKEDVLATRLMPILVLTADATPEAKKKALTEGASDFLTKPFDLAEVDLRIKNLLLNVYLMDQLRNQNHLLEEKVAERTAALSQMNRELVIAKERLEGNIKAIQLQNNMFREIGWIQSHVVRAPLARLMGAIAVLQMENATETDRGEMIDIILTSAKELDLVIRDISEKSHLAKILDEENAGQLSAPA